MLGAIIGDIAGSTYEFGQPSDPRFIEIVRPDSFFTDDTVLTVATMAALLDVGPEWGLHSYKQPRFADFYTDFGLRYPNRGYGGSFAHWLLAHPIDRGPYGSMGNGSAMRVSPIAAWAKSDAECLALAGMSAECTHNHPEGMVGAKAVALLGWFGWSRELLYENGVRFLFHRFRYWPDDRSEHGDLLPVLDRIRPGFQMDETCPGTVPPAIACFNEGTDYQSVIRLALSLGGDADTIACIAGGIAEAHYQSIPPFMLNEARKVLPLEFLQIIETFVYTTVARHYHSWHFPDYYKRLTDMTAPVFKKGKRDGT